MNYLVERLILHKATIRNLEYLVELETEITSRMYPEKGARLMAAWMGNSETLLQVTQVSELENLEAALSLSQAFFMDLDRDEAQQLQSLVFQRNLQVYRSEGEVFTQAFRRAVEKNQSSPVKTYTVATLDVRPAKMKEFVAKQEVAMNMGMPMVAFIRSVTGRQYQVIDLWEDDLQAVGYQPQSFYDSIGRTEEWWNWIRDVAPREKMEKVSMLPYSPMK
jgi:hypothetical protein